MTRVTNVRGVRTSKKALSNSFWLLVQAPSNPEFSGLHAATAVLVKHVGGYLMATFTMKQQ